MGVKLMKRLVIITVGKTHSGKTTFARALEKELANSIVMTKITTYYKNLQPKRGPNTLKFGVSNLEVKPVQKRRAKVMDPVKPIILIVVGKWLILLGCFRKYCCFRA